MTYLEHCRYRNVDGVCIVCSHFDDSEVLQLVSSPLPLVTIDHVFNNKACVQSENRQGIEALTRYILSMGHKKVAFIYGAQDTVSDIRLTSFLRTMNDAGLSVPDDYLIASPYHDPASTREATAQLLSLRDRPTCILMPDDYSALGGMDAIRATGSEGSGRYFHHRVRRRGHDPDVSAAADHRRTGRFQNRPRGGAQARSSD